jgi:hypothetical protein
MRAAMQRSCEGPKEIRCGEPVRLSIFLKALIGIDEQNLDLGPNISEEHRSNLLKNGMVFWNHFNEVYYTPNSKDLLKFLHCGMAVQCASSKQSTFDHLISSKKT